MVLATLKVYNQSTGACVEVLHQKKAFFIKRAVVSGEARAPEGQRTFAWAKLGGPANAWEHVKAAAGWT